MKPAAFEYHRPQDLAEALATLERYGDEATPIAGGQSLVPMMNLRLAQPGHLVDLNFLDELAYIREQGAGLEIGAMTRHHAIATSEQVEARCPLLAEAASTIAHYAIRQRGTIGGSLAHADPAAQLPLVAVTLNARMCLRGARGAREVDSGAFFLGLMSTAIEPGELLVAVRLPGRADGEGHAFTFLNRRHGDYAIVSVACTAVLDGARVAAVRLGVGGATAAPVVLAEPAAALRGRRADAALAAEAGALARAAVQPMESPGVEPLYRSELIEVLVARALAKAFERAGAGTRNRG